MTNNKFTMFSGLQVKKMLTLFYIDIVICIFKVFCKYFGLK